MVVVEKPVEFLSIELMPEEAPPKSPLAVELGVIVKNTFLDVEDGECDPRRCSSSPPSLRWREDSRSLPQSPLQGPVRAKRWSEAFEEASASTTSGSPRAYSGSACGGSDVSEDTNALATPSGSSLNPYAPVWSPTWSSGENSFCGSPITGPPDGLPVCSPTGFASSDQMFPAAPMMDQYQAHRLNSNAKAWQPTVGPAAPPTVPMAMTTMVPPPPPPGAPPPATGPPPAGVCGVCEPVASPGASHNFRRQFEALMEAAKSALHNSAGVVGVEVFEGLTSCGQGWTLVAWLHPEESNKDQALQAAKDALMRGAETSENVYVMGYLQKPFTLTESGFTGMLGGMYDESRACWDVFTKGFCRRESICRWQHPVCQTAISVEVRYSCGQ
mmetsp:Transcript_14333/g.26603  ORF Transcript_14333/g.26603 Transcript_14333/m.26603 type:complete len:386 (-) Transcript_14333:137-1294(-)